MLGDRSAGAAVVRRPGVADQGSYVPTERGARVIVDEAPADARDLQRGVFDVDEVDGPPSIRTAAPAKTNR